MPRDFGVRAMAFARLMKPVSYCMSMPATMQGQLHGKPSTMGQLLWRVARFHYCATEQCTWRYQPFTMIMSGA